MDIVQSLRRLGQKIGSGGWSGAIDHETAQLPLIEKLYANNGLELTRTCFACPEQYEVFKDGKQIAYYRLRHGEFRVDFPECGGETIFEASPNGDGIFDDNERLSYLIKAMRSVLNRIAHV